MKSVAHQIWSVVMAVLVLFSTVSWTIEKHICMGRVMDVALFSKDQDCGMEAAMLMMEEDSDENHFWIHEQSGGYGCVADCMQGGDLTRIAVARAEPVGRLTGWRAAMPLTQWSIVKL